MSGYSRGIGMKTVTKKVVGVILVILGLAALLTPLSPGSWLILIGLEFLGLRILLENRLRKWTDKRPNSRVAKVIRKGLRLKVRDAAGQSGCEQARKQRP
jgi:hypothetical protein